MYEENNFYQSSDSSFSSVSEEKLNYGFQFAKTFLWMFLGVFITFLVGWLISLSQLAVLATLSLPVILITSIAQIIICFSLSKQALVKLNKNTTLSLFILYSVLNGLLFGFLFYVLEATEFVLAFALTSGLFLCMGLFGIIFKNAARKLYRFAYVGLFFLLISLIVSYFVTHDWFFTAISCLGIIVFSIITMVDIRRIKDITANSPNPEAVSIYGAFVLYLDFINIFLYIVRLFLSNRRN